MQLRLSTWTEIEDYLRRRRDVLVPIGSTEQHGPSGLIGTDEICPEAIARTVGEREGVLVGPTLGLGNAQHHLAFPGTVSLRPGTLVAVLCDVIQSFSRHGFERIVFLNGHGGNVAPAHTAFAEVQAGVTLDGRPPVRCALHNWWDGARVSAYLLEAFGDADGLHGTCGEISLTQFVHPDHVKPVTTEGRGPRGEEFHDAEDFRRRYPDGRMGSDPSLCSPEHGARIHEAAVEDALELFRVMDGRP